MINILIFPTSYLPNFSVYPCIKETEKWVRVEKLD